MLVFWKMPGSPKGQGSLPRTVSTRTSKCGSTSMNSPRPRAGVAQLEHARGDVLVAVAQAPGLAVVRQDVHQLAAVLAQKAVAGDDPGRHLAWIAVVQLCVCFMGASLAASGELVVEDPLVRHALGLEDLDAGVDHARAAAEVGLVVVQLLDVPVHHLGDQARLPVPVVRRRPGRTGRGRTGSRAASSRAPASRPPGRGRAGAGAEEVGGLAPASPAPPCRGAWT